MQTRLVYNTNKACLESSRKSLEDQWYRKHKNSKSYWKGTQHHLTGVLTQIGLRPKRTCYKRICLSFPLFSAFASSYCRRPRFAIAAMPSTQTLQAARNKDEAEWKSNARLGFKILTKDSKNVATHDFYKPMKHFLYPFSVIYNKFAPENKAIAPRDDTLTPIQLQIFNQKRTFGDFTPTTVRRSPQRERDKKGNTPP